jgi:hypothetical protein
MNTLPCKKRRVRLSLQELKKRRYYHAMHPWQLLHEPDLQNQQNKVTVDHPQAAHNPSQKSTNANNIIFILFN